MPVYQVTVKREYKDKLLVEAPSYYAVDRFMEGEEKDNYSLWIFEQSSIRPTYEIVPANRWHKADVVIQEDGKVV